MKTIIGFAALVLVFAGVAWGDQFKWNEDISDGVVLIDIDNSPTRIKGVYQSSIGNWVSSEFGVECDQENGNCISRNEISNILKAALTYVLFNNGYVKSLEPVEDIEVKMIEAIKCLEMANDGCKFLQ